MKGLLSTSQRFIVFTVFFLLLASCGLNDNSSGPDVDSTTLKPVAEVALSEAEPANDSSDERDVSEFPSFSNRQEGAAQSSSNASENQQSVVNTEPNSATGSDAEPTRCVVMSTDQHR